MGKQKSTKNRPGLRLRFSLSWLLLFVFLISMILALLHFDENSIRFREPKLKKIKIASSQTCEVIACRVENIGSNSVWFQSGNDLTSISPKSCYPLESIPESSAQDRYLGYYQWNEVKPGGKIWLYLPTQREGAYWVGIDVKDWIGRRHTISRFLRIDGDGTMAFSREDESKNNEKN